VRLMAKVTIPLESGDDGPTNTGAIPLKVQRAMQTLRPEAAYFLEEEGKWECFFVFNLDFATLVRPLFPGLDASFQVRPVMNAAEFQALGDARGGDQPTIGKAEDLVTDLSPEPNRPPEWLRPPDPEWPYVTTQRERDKRAKKFLKED
jgi:hypothetical protein